MGGLCGVVHFRGDPPERPLVEGMSRRLRHRGPDGDGVFAQGEAILAHRRKAIITRRSDQPLVDGDLVLLLDGWVFGHLALARRLGWDDPDLSDTVVLLEAFRRFGPDCLAEVDGSFAMAIWDRRARSLWLARDRMGTRPLYWTRQGPKVAFASELPPLLDVPWVSRELNREHLAEYLSFRVVHAPRTLVRGVQQVEPAQLLRLDADEVVARPYWTPRYASPESPPPDEGQRLADLQEAMQRAVERRLVADVPAALYLSGGLGSTAIAAAARRLRRPLPTFTLGFADDPNPETPFAGRVANLLGLEHHEVVVGSADLARAFEDGIRALGHPIGNPAVFLQLLLAREVGNHARIVLSGDGGEELFGGKMLDPIARAIRGAQAFARLPAPARRALQPLLARSRRGRQWATPPDRFGLDLEIGGSDLFNTALRRAWFRDEALAKPALRHDVLAPLYDGLRTDPINAVLHAFLRSWLQEGSLVRADRTAAAAGLDVRFPLLDLEVFSLAASLPGAAKIRRVGGSLHTRWPLRALLDGVLPPPLVHRPKRGMPAPLDPWLAGPGRLFFEDRYAALERDPERLWKPEALVHLKRDVGKKPGAGLLAWSLIILDAWRTETLDRR